MELLVPQKMCARTAALVADDEGASVDAHQAAEPLGEPPGASHASRANPERAIFQADFQWEVLLAEVWCHNCADLTPCTSCHAQAPFPLLCRESLGLAQLLQLVHKAPPLVLRPCDVTKRHLARPVARQAFGSKE